MTTITANLGAKHGAPHTPEAHPKGLYVLFATEMWERFSYYGMRALLVLYLINYWQWQPSEASSVYKWYTSLVFLTPLAGGFLADRFLGLRTSIVIGAVLMAVGQFLLMFDQLPMFYLALGFLVAGNGFFKPNISTLVGKLYRADDARRDGAFTIFYMGINLGAFFSPLICAALRVRYGFRYGFAAAGVGMLIGLVVFLLGQKRVIADVHAVGNSMTLSNKHSAKNVEDADDNVAPSGGFAGVVRTLLTAAMIAIAIVVPLHYGRLAYLGEARLTDLIMPVAFALVSGWMGLTLFKIRGASRDKSTVIFALFSFVVLFWMAFEQAGNSMTIWADSHTILNVGAFDIPAEWFQSVNAIFVFALAPLFAILWVWLVNRNVNISTPMKMFIGLVMVALSFLVMVGAAVVENKTESRVALEAVPAQVDLSKLDAGRMSYDASRRELVVRGVLPKFAHAQAIRAAMPHNEHMEHASVAELEAVPDAPRQWCAALGEMAKVSQAAKVSALWLLFSYFLATLGELCLSPVGLSMVTKLAPARFASLFMGIWLLSSSVAQYVGGSIGESWGRVAPVQYFSLFVWTSLIGAAVLALLISPLKKLMHNVR